MSASGLYKINGLDLYDRFGFIPDDKNVDRLLPWPKSKTVSSHNWNDENGTEYDLSARYFENSTFTLSGRFEAPSLEVFWLNFSSMWYLVSQTGELTLYSGSLQRNLQAFYLEMTKAERLFPFSRGGKIVVNAEISFQIISVLAEGDVPQYDGDAMLTKQIKSDVTEGGISAGDILVQGLKFTDFVEKLLTKVIPASYNAPSVALSANPNPDNAYFEVAQQIAVTIALTFNKADAGNATGYAIYKNGALVASQSTFTENIGPAVPNVISYNGSVAYAQGDVKTDNHGDPSPAGQIAAGTVGSNTKTYRFIYPWLYGTSDNGSGFDAYASGSKVVQPATGSLNINFNAATPRFLWFAHDASLPTKSAWYLTALNNGAIGGAANLFASPVLITVNGNGWSASFKLYVTNLKTSSTSTMTIS